MDTEQHTLGLPDGYGIGLTEDHEERRLLVLKRPNGSAAATFEFSDFGPDSRKIRQMAWEDLEGPSKTV